ncbi:hypothetical protein [Frigoribacterium sp. UYMn621]|uniref:hypothetical protein n=1 Tax=Frigoribacterium sp. UYMn621 TaxID=3156343 RepID=UPI00339888C8
MTEFDGLELMKLALQIGDEIFSIKLPAHAMFRNDSEAKRTAAICENFIYNTLVGEGPNRLLWTNPETGASA